jgi:hypothetical protein
MQFQESVRGMCTSARSRVQRYVALSALILLSVSGGAQTAHAGIVVFDEQFEWANSEWTAAGGAGFDFGRGLAHKGTGNAWVRNTTGWNAVNYVVGVQPNAECTASAWLRFSNNLTAGYMTVRVDGQANGLVLQEIKLTGPNPNNAASGNYNQYSFRFNPRNSYEVLFYVGLWGNGQDSWIQVDDVVISCPTPF